MIEDEINIVDQFVAELDHPHKAVINTIREKVLKSNSEITEHIKWNAPSFSFKGEHRVTFKLYPPETIQLIFHRDAKVKDTQDFIFEDTTGLLKWITADRGIVTLEIKNVTAKMKDLLHLINAWVEATS